MQNRRWHYIGVNLHSHQWRGFFLFKSHKGLTIYPKLSLIASHLWIKTVSVSAVRGFLGGYKYKAARRGSASLGFLLLRVSAGRINKFVHVDGCKADVSYVCCWTLMKTLNRKDQCGLLSVYESFTWNWFIATAGVVSLIFILFLFLWKYSFFELILI